MLTEYYKFAPHAERIVGIELTHAGKIRPFTLRKINGFFCPDGEQLEAVQLADSAVVTFDIEVPSSREMRNWGTIAHQFSDWDPGEVYGNINVNILGLTWPFGTEFSTGGGSPGAATGSLPASKVCYTVAKKEVNGEKYWTLSWRVQCGKTVQDSSLNLSRNGRNIYVALRLIAKCDGSVTFPAGIGPAGKKVFKVEPIIDAPVADGGSAADGDASVFTEIAKLATSYHVKSKWAKATADIPTECRDPLDKVMHEAFVNQVTQLMSRRR